MSGLYLTMAVSRKPQVKLVAVWSSISLICSMSQIRKRLFCDCQKARTSQKYTPMQAMSAQKNPQH